MHIDSYGDTLCALVSAAAMASTGHQVVLHITDDVLLEQLQQGICPSREPGLAELLSEQVSEQRLRYVALHEPVDKDNQVIWLALSPQSEQQAFDIIQAFPADPFKRWLLVNQSTFQVGTSELLQARLREASGADSAVVSLPDLLTEGNAIQSFKRADHWLVGTDSPWASQMVSELLRPFNRRRDCIMLMRPRDAEFTKLAITGMLATRLSYMNDMANLADSLDVDIEQVRQGMGADKRIGEAYLYPGCGFGGLSFSRDVMSLASTLTRRGQQAQLLTQVMAINERQKELLFRKLWTHCDGDLRGRKVAIWGVAFKPETGRIDNAPALKLIEALWAQGVQVRVHDPRALPALQAWAGERDDLLLFDDPYLALEGVDALMLVTEWKSYWSPNWSRLQQLMRAPILLDGRNIWDPAFVREQGFVYFGVGRG
ncbi:MAG: UDP-glucose/GDP-mannose dehydrogenase family protein [Gammaproteobacteria bacterium HGW-Gammaproteobacteria-11]|nr:MAG: UDP-glucose/GDP-mannose dehydrogenase family protein [Gammaproteobacteria bacterium HGW-Gammaproteobacteria-11]